MFLFFVCFFFYLCPYSQNRIIHSTSKIVVICKIPVLDTKQLLQVWQKLCLILRSFNNFIWNFSPKHKKKKEKKIVELRVTFQDQGDTEYFSISGQQFLFLVKGYSHWNFTFLHYISFFFFGGGTPFIKPILWSTWIKWESPESRESVFATVENLEIGFLKLWVCFLKLGICGNYLSESGTSCFLATQVYPFNNQDWRCSTNMSGKIIELNQFPRTAKSPGQHQWLFVGFLTSHKAGEGELRGLRGLDCGLKYQSRLWKELQNQRSEISMTLIKFQIY